MKKIKKTYYEPGYEYPTEFDIADDPVFDELREQCEDVINGTNEAIVLDESLAEKIISLIDYGSNMHYLLEESLVENDSVASLYENIPAHIRNKYNG